MLIIKCNISVSSFVLGAVFHTGSIISASQQPYELSIVCLHFIDEELDMKRTGNKKISISKKILF